MKAQVLVAVLFAVEIATVPRLFCNGARLLRDRFDSSDDPSDIGDPSGYLAFANARSFVPGASKANKAALTPEAAESGSNNQFNGYYRNVAPKDRNIYATVEADPVSMNPNRRSEVVKTRARSAQDLVGIKNPNLSSGATQFGALVMGGSAYANTYEGATAAATTDSVMVNQGGRGGKRKTVIANSMLTASTGAMKAASRSGSFATTAQPVGSMALSGAANGRVVIAQANSAVAMAQTERVNIKDPISRTAWQN